MRPLALALALGLGPVVCACETDGPTGRDPPRTFQPDEPPAGHALNADLEPLRRCPGDPGCPRSDDPTLYAGAATLDITPTIDHVVLHAPGSAAHEFNPLAGDRCIAAECDLSDPASCATADPTLCTWIGGFGNGRSATGVSDPVSVRCTVLRQGETGVALCTVDTILWLYIEVLRTRELLARSHAAAAADIDLVVIASNHLHQSQDTAGFYGPDTGTTGLHEGYNALVRERTAEAIAQAHAALEPVTARFGASRVDGHLAGTDPSGHRAAAFVSDTRDPVVIDDELRTIGLESASGGGSVATLVNWCAHPEYAGSRNRLISADYLGALRDSLEDARGGVAMVFPGLIGGQVGPGLAKFVGPDGTEIEDPIERAKNAGRLFAEYALESLGGAAGATTLEAPALGFRSREIFVEAANDRLLIGYNLDLFDVELEHFDDTQPFGEGNRPVIRSEVVVLDLGPAEIVTVPGEPHADEWLVTREGVGALEAPYPFTPAPFVILNDERTNPMCGADGYSACDDGPPDIASADRALAVDRFRDPRAALRWVLATTHGYNGYIVPAYDFILHEQNPWLDEATPGNHYEETVTLGPNVAREVLDPIRQILKSRPAITR